MNCETIEIPLGDGTVARGIICGGRRRPRCHKCGRPSEAQCDFPIGKTARGKRRDCDRHLCDDHRHRGITPNVDFCDDHFPIAEAAYKRRLERSKETTR